ncbi:hypothetical protein ACJJTC_000516 [Scirpophaga incertulas]
MQECVSKVRSNIFKPLGHSIRHYAKKAGDDCRMAVVDLPAKVDPDCPQPCMRSTKKKRGILHKIKMKVVEGGTNFGTPFRRLLCKPPEPVVVQEKEPAPAPQKKALALPAPRPGLQVAVLGADTAVGQYVALLLKQCPCIKKLRLYDASCPTKSECNRNLCQVVHDLQHINTNCLVQAFSCADCQLQLCLQNSDIVLMLETSLTKVDMPHYQRFACQAPIVKEYSDAIASECPKAFVIVCTTPIDCMVPLVAETLKETGWYDPRRLLGSVAVPEMRASTLAARALSLEPWYTRVPCVGGTEGEALVPLFSRAVEYFDFAKHNAEMMTAAVRNAPVAVARNVGPCSKAADLSEAHALAGLVNKVSHALLCKDVPRVRGFVETDATQVISPARFIASTVDLGGGGIKKLLGLPKMNALETTLVNVGLNSLCERHIMVQNWYLTHHCPSKKSDAFRSQFFTVRPDERFNECAHANF